MDSMTLIAIASIITAGLTIALGSIGPALGEGRAVATGAELAGAAARQLGDHHPHPVRGPGDDRVDRDLLLRGLDDPAVRQPVLEPRHRPGRGKIDAMLIDWFTVGAQVLNFLILVWLMKRFLYKPVLDAIDARETAHRRRAGRCRGEAGRGRQRSATRSSKRNDELRPAARDAAGKGHWRGGGRAPATARRSAHGGRCAARQAPAKDGAAMRPASTARSSSRRARRYSPSPARPWPSWPRPAWRPAATTEFIAPPAGARRRPTRSRLVDGARRRQRAGPGTQRIRTARRATHGDSAGRARNSSPANGRCSSRPPTR